MGFTTDTVCHEGGHGTNGRMLYTQVTAFGREAFGTDVYREGRVARRSHMTLKLSCYGDSAPIIRVVNGVSLRRPSMPRLRPACLRSLNVSASIDLNHTGHSPRLEVLLAELFRFTRRTDRLTNSKDCADISPRIARSPRSQLPAELLSRLRGSRPSSRRWEEGGRAAIAQPSLSCRFPLLLLADD